MSPGLAELAEELGSSIHGDRRLVVAIAGAPGSGKSTLAAELVAELGRAGRPGAVLVPMDGFHFDDAVLEARGLKARKGAPETFDVAGFAVLLQRIRSGEDAIAIPVFDRSLEISRAGARIVQADQPIVVVEGNYLLLDRSPWDALAPYFDRTIFIDVPETVLRERLVRRWLDLGFDPEAARARAEGNDLVNARLVMSASRAADRVWRPAA